MYDENENVNENNTFPFWKRKEIKIKNKQKLIIYQNNGRRNAFCSKSNRTTNPFHLNSVFSANDFQKLSKNEWNLLARFL